jgi:hypothetical protein
MRKFIISIATRRPNDGAAGQPGQRTRWRVAGSSGSGQEPPLALQKKGREHLRPNAHQIRSADFGCCRESSDLRF